MKKLLLITLSLLIASGGVWGASQSFDYYCTEEEKVVMQFEKEVYKSEDFDTLKIKGECKNCNKTSGLVFKYEVELQEAEKVLGTSKYKCSYHPVLSMMNCYSEVSLLVIKMSSKEFFLAQPIILDRLSRTTLSKGSCVSFKP